MQVRKSSDGYFVVLKRGEKIHASLTALAKEKMIPSATLTGIGAVMNTRLGFYHLHKKTYDERLYSEEAELVNLSGNITWFEGNPVVHIHLTIGNTDFQAIAGHLFEAEAAVTAEIFVAVKGAKITRKFVPEMGLNLQQLDEK